MARPKRFPNKKLVAFDDETIEALEAWRKTQSPIPSEPEAIRSILSDWLRDKGYLPSDQEGTRPEDLNASNDD